MGIGGGVLCSEGERLNLQQAIFATAGNPALFRVPRNALEANPLWDRNLEIGGGRKKGYCLLVRISSKANACLVVSGTQRSLTFLLR